jgi:hypothetical protein
MTKVEKAWLHKKLREIINGNPYWLTYEDLSTEFYSRHGIWLDKDQLVSLGCQKC